MAPEGDLAAGKELVRRYLADVFSNGNVAAMERYLAGEEFMAGVLELVARWRTAFSDFHEEVTQVYADNDRVITVSELSGTHDGVLESRLGPIQPTGRKVRWSRIAVRRLQDGKFADGFFEQDELGLLQQLGVFGDDGGLDSGRHSPLFPVPGRLASR